MLKIFEAFGAGKGAQSYRGWLVQFKT